LKAGDRLRVRYELRLARGETARAKAEGIAREQTVEIAPGIAPIALERRTMGALAAIGETAGARAEAVIDYPWRELVSDLPQLLNLLFGNVSMQRGVRVAAIDWPPALLERFPGPRHGGAGVRALVGVEGRPLLATVLKPIGLAPRELARHAADCVRGGIDLVKDDHSLADQPSAPFRERVLAVASEVRRANRAVGGKALYLPNLTGPVDRLAERLDDLAEAGVRGALVAPMILGLDTVRSLAASSGLALLAHPTLTGTLFRRDHGIAPELLLGDLFRLAGADLVNFPLPGGRFEFPRATFDAVRARLAAPLGKHAPSLPMVAGGVGAERIARHLGRLGDDVVYLVGGELYRGGRVRERAAELAALVAKGAGSPR
jgi:ribulose-bisphosphate carboxylase large chain